MEDTIVPLHITPDTLVHLPVQTLTVHVDRDVTVAVHHEKSTPPPNFTSYLDIWNGSSVTDNSITGNSSITDYLMVNGSASVGLLDSGNIILSNSSMDNDSINLAVLLWVIQSLLTGSVCLFGLLGNVLAFIVLMKDPKQNIVSVLLSALCVVDWFLVIFTLVFSVIPIGCFYWGACEVGVAIYRLLPSIWPWSTIAQMAMIWITVAATLNRYIVVCHPFSGSAFSKAKTGVKIVAVVIITSVVFNLPRLINAYLPHSQGQGQMINSTKTRLVNPVLDMAIGTNQCQSRRDELQLSHQALETPLYQQIYLIGLTWAFMYIIPLIILFFLNIRLGVELKRSKAKHSKLTCSQDKDSHSTTVNIIAIVTVFLFCQTPDFLTLLLWYPPLGISLDVWYWHIASAVSSLLQAVNSSVNIVIYTMFYRRFRSRAAKLFCCYRQHMRSASGLNSPDTKEMWLTSD